MLFIYSSNNQNTLLLLDKFLEINRTLLKTYSYLPIIHSLRGSTFSSYYQKQLLEHYIAEGLINPSLNFQMYLTDTISPFTQN